MAKCDLQILIDKAEAAYSSGEKVTGRVKVLVDAEVSCKKITLSYGWETSGRGNKKTQYWDTEIQSEIMLSPGEHAYPFEFVVPSGIQAQSDSVPDDALKKQLAQLSQLPDESKAAASKIFQVIKIPGMLPGPFTYRGQFLNINWFIRAQAHIPWKADARAEKPFTVTPGETAPPGYAVSRAPVDYKEAEPAGKFVMGCLGISMLLVFLCALAIYGMVIGWKRADDFIGFAVILGIIGIGGIIYSIKQILVGKKVGSFAFQLDASAVCPGDKINCSLSFQSRGALHIDKITATLQAKEEVVSGSGKSRSTHTKNVFTQEHILSQTRELFSGQPLRLQKEIPVPQNAPYSIDVSQNSLYWTLDVRIVIARWPDWSHTERLFVVPWVL